MLGCLMLLINLSLMLQKNDQYTVTIIGLGNIGLLYDLNRGKDSKEFLTHTRSVFFHKNFKLTYLIDSDLKKLDLAKEKYGHDIIYLTNINHNYHPTDIIVLSSVPMVNSMYLNKLKINHEVKFFLIEKPFLNQNEKISNYKAILKKSYINYYRKSLPFFKKLRRNIDNRKFGNLIGVNVFYSKGLSNNGSHLIDLMNFFFKSSYNLNSIKIINYKNDYSADDESVTFSVDYKYNSLPFTTIFHALDERKFSLIELDLFFEKSRFRIYDFGGKIEIYKVENDKVFSGYNNLVSTSVESSDIDSYGKHTYQTIYNILKGEELNYSTLNDELKIYKLKENILKKLSKFKKKSRYE
jgi:hypothetical protein